jgi:hypothetical protein
MLHLGTPNLHWLANPVNLGAIVLLAVGLWRAVAGPAPEQPVRTRVFVPVTVLAALGWLATPAAVLFAASWVTAVAFAYIACVTAWAWMQRDRQSQDDENGGGGDQDVPPEPEDPSGGGIDWDAFESAFWSHVRDRDLTPA